MNDYQKFIHATRYARWLEDKGRRETWEETVVRYADYWMEKGLIDGKEWNQICEAIINLQVVPSMRALMTAGPALDRDNVAGYNCAYLTIDDPRAFDELMYILLCGTGVGFGIELDDVDKLPVVSEEFSEDDTVHVVGDSKIGWAKATRTMISGLYAGSIIQMDYSRVRPAGARLKTFGGRASGPEPLIELHKFLIDVFKGAAGRRLTDLECHDICCKIAEIVVVGGVRRSALISLSSPMSDSMAKAKYGAWWVGHGQRALANNSAVYNEKPRFDFFMKEMQNLYLSYSGERGIFSREAAQKIASRNGRREFEGVPFGCNPCSEILLKPAEFCNLSEVIVRATDSMEELKEKVRLATILGTLQSTLTKFRYLRKTWKQNCEKERLLGVSLTGIMDNKLLNGTSGHDTGKLLEQLRDVAIETNKVWAERLGIPQSAAITCVKPSGTVSQLALCASGIHPNYSQYYVRRVRQDNKDPVTDFLISAGVPNEPCTMKPDTTTIFSFPTQMPRNSVFRDDIGAIGQLELWKVYQESWCEHKPSITVYYKDDEFFAVCQWIWDNWDIMSGISLLPYDNGSYNQAPYEEIDRDAYRKMSKEMPKIDWDLLSAFERGDTTTSSQELACTGGACEIVGSAE